MTWTKFFDGIYLINLPERTQRFMDAAEELEKYDIPFMRIPAVKSLSGKEGHGALVLTIKNLFGYCLNKGYQRILVFEDDSNFIENPNNYMPAVIRQLDGRSWDMLSLGPNTHAPLEQVDKNLLTMKHCRALHAVAYNFSALKFVTTTMTRTPDDHLDVLFEQHLQPHGNCYCTYPLLCTQKDGPSDISDETDKSYIVKRFAANTMHLQTDQW